MMMQCCIIKLNLEISMRLKSEGSMNAQTCTYCPQYEVFVGS